MARAPSSSRTTPTACSARYRGRPLGSFGRFATLSFHETKNFICGEGGALVVNDAADVDRAHVVLDKGTNRRAFLHGQVDKYSWQDVGSSFGLGDVLAAFLYGQLERRDAILDKRRAVFDRYQAAAGAARPTSYGSGCRSCRATASRRTTCSTCCSRTRRRATGSSHRCVRRRRARDVPLRPAAQLAGRPALRGASRPTCPVTDDISGRLLRLPFYTSLTAADMDRVVAAFTTAIRT